ncbi:MAG: mitochondrial fission ELM1 family protein [Geminicoccaceae bacterium]|nr:mitochondrial fission ELM1 family protein [Geminicoccaceae bacterium]
MPDSLDRWPFSRQDPDRVVLDARPGTRPSDKPPVRIYLGTEEAQYRAERIFFYSIEKVRDPARVYEIYLMKNVAGFDRSRWRTGFTNYRYAIPEFAGFKGRAIYNDVDQIYLADPALLFDLDMGDHGYLAISAKDTSVMLIDCARMAELWNRGTAASKGKHELINKPAAIPDLWGRLDPHWNARDQEYVEGLTKCLHYTALHQQPWQPFPGDYSYHPNPLAYVWHDLEREADAQGFEVFDRERPSPDFARRLDANNGGAVPDAAPKLSGDARRLVEDLGVRSALLVTAIGGDPPPGALPGGIALDRFHLAPSAAWPEGKRDMVIARGLLERLPPADLPWVLNELFQRAEKLLYAALPATEPEGMGSARWWEKRLAEAARFHSGVSWHLDVADRAAPIPGTERAFGARCHDGPEAPAVWALLDGDPGRDAQVKRLAEALGWGFAAKRVAHGPWSRLPNVVRGASPGGLDRRRSDPLDPPWPDLVIAAGRRAARVAAWIGRQGGKRTRVVQLGRPETAFGLFNLIVVQPQHRLPIRDNVLHVTAPLAGGRDAAAGRLEGRWRERLEAMAAPRSVLVAGPGKRPYRLDAAAARRFGQLAAARLDDLGGSLAVWFEPDTPDAVRAALQEGVGREAPVLSDDPSAAGEGAREALVRAADRCLLMGDDVDLLAAACAAGKPVDLFEPPERLDRYPLARPIRRLLGLMVGGGTSYRGTPLQQHAVSRLLDRLLTRGWLRLPRDLKRLHRALAARGLVTRLDDGRVIATKRPLNDVDLVVERVRRLMQEDRRSAA